MQVVRGALDHQIEEDDKEQLSKKSRYLPVRLPRLSTCERSATLSLL